MHKPKWEFVQSEVLGLCIRASLQRAHVYASSVEEHQREHLRTELANALRDIGSRYSEEVAESQHEQNILELASRVSERCKTALAGRHLRLGSAQKALNLYLKYLWCLDRIPTPPHCPFDRRVIMELPQHAQVAWTHLDDLNSYRDLVTAARVAARGKSLSEWELRVFSRAMK